MSDSVLRWTRPLAALVVIFGLWQLAGRVWTFPGYLFTPGEIARAWFASLDPETGSAVLATTLRAVAGFLIATAVALPVATVAALVRPVERILEPYIGFFFALPKISLLPLLVVWLGYSDSARITMIAVSAFFPIFVYMFAGVRGINPGYLKVASNVGASRRERFLHVVLPAVAPMAMAGVRIGVAISLIVTFAAEVVGQSPNGLGRLIQDGFSALDYDQMYAGIVMFALIGLGLDMLLRLMTRRSPGLWGEGVPA
ncbi:ABC transporter permease [Streptomyces tuirus]|uniref:ABC transporter permease n=1 Tax=Streptomyces tuirus TaxID=68278 RepID=A0A941FB39_9ACTN|nr:ABC transporter permease [Streptomyces tuirus]